MALTRLHTDGKLIKNAAGQTVDLRGISVSDLLTQPWFNGGVGEIARRLNTIYTVLDGHVITVMEAYINVHWKDGVNTGWSNTEFSDVVGAMDEMRDYCVAHDIYFIIKADDNGDPTPYVTAEGGDPSILSDWFMFWVNHYASVPNFVGIDIFNEPWWATGNQAKWRATVEYIYDIIYAADPTLLVLCSSFPFTSISSDFINNPIGPQAVLAFDDYWKHCVEGRSAYASNDFAAGLVAMESLFGPAGFNAYQNNVPVFMCEFGWGDLSYDNDYAVQRGWATLTLAQDLQACNDWYYVLNEHGIHWSLYTLWMNPHGNCGVCEDTYDNLTDWGKIWAQYLPTPLGIHNLTVNSNIHGIPFIATRV